MNCPQLCLRLRQYRYWVAVLQKYVICFGTAHRPEYVIPEVSEYRNVVIFTVSLWTAMVTPGTAYSTTQRDVTENLYIQQQYCDNLRSHITA